MSSLTDLFSELDAVSPPPRLQSRVVALEVTRRTARGRFPRLGSWLVASAGCVLVVGALALAAHSRRDATASGHHPDRGLVPREDVKGTAFAAKLVSRYHLEGVRVVVLDGNPGFGSDKPWLYATIRTDGAKGLEAKWDVLRLIDAYRATSRQSARPSIAGFSIIRAGEPHCVTPSAASCKAGTAFSLEHVIPRDPSAWSADARSERSAVTERVRKMSNAALVSIHFAKGVYGALPEVIIKTPDPVSFAQRYKYGTPAVLGDTSRYEGYLVTVQDSDGNLVSLNGGSSYLSMGVGWTRSDVRSIVQSD